MGNRNKCGKSPIKLVVKIVIRAATALLILMIFVPVFFIDQFKIGGNSMDPVLEYGDHILVNKLIMGARIYTGYDFSSPWLKCFRMPGFRKIRPGDIAVFNYPHGRDGEKIEFRINYVYAKRCIACPGDTLSISSGFYKNSSCPGKFLGSAENQNRLCCEPDSVLEENGVFLQAFPFSPKYGWTIRNFGPLFIPGKGSRIMLDTCNVKLYERLIEYETGSLPEILDGKIYIGGRQSESYVFCGNWYFFGGDNVLDSKDSRYIGMVPEDYIVGIAKRTLFSLDPFSGNIRLRKVVKRIDSNNGSYLEKALSLAGNNRIELQKVLARYSITAADSLKYKAAVFLIENMPGHQYYQDKALDNFLEFYPLLYKVRKLGRAPEMASNIIRDKYGFLNIAGMTPLEDIETVDSAFLCDNIEWAFKVREEQPWNDNVPFEEFCEYVLPYRIGNETLHEWRKYYYERYNSILDSLRTSKGEAKEDPVNAAIVVAEAIMGADSMFFTSFSPANFPHIGPEAAEWKNGTCRDLSDFAIYVYRSLGIPCASDVMPMRGDDNVGHSWVALWDKDGAIYCQDFSDNILPVRESPIWKDCKTKVYRRTYSCNRELEKNLSGNSKEDMPVIFKDSHLIDVTKSYSADFMESMEIPRALLYRGRSSDPVFLCLPSFLSWAPVAYGILCKDKSVFEDIDRGYIMRAASVSAGKIIYRTDPFYIGDDGTFVELKPDGNIQNMTLYTKFPLKYEMDLRERMRGGVFEGSNDRSFNEKDTLYMIEGLPPARLQVSVRSKTSKRYKYLRYYGPDGSSCNIAEISFYDFNGNKLDGKVIGTPGCRGGDGSLEYTNAFDGDCWTPFDYRYLSGGWTGLELSVPKSVARIVYTPRNMDNYVRPGDDYELYYCDKVWKSAGVVHSDSDSVSFRGVPAGCLYLLKNLTRGRQERVFRYENGRQIYFRDKNLE